MPLSAVSLFSGAGGMDVGIKAAGFEVGFANDIDSDACQTYRLNHGAAIVEGDIRDHSARLLAHRGTDLLFGGPPCQGFSVAGKMDPSDARSQLLMSFFDVVDTLQPGAFICENVKALASLNKWSAVRGRMHERTQAQYETTLVVLNASSFGVPQARERMFFVGVHRSRFPATMNLSAELERELCARRTSALTVAEVVTALGRAGSELNQRVCNAKITYAKNPVLRRSPYAGMLFNGAGRPLAPTGVSSTLAASMGGNKTPIVDEAEIFDGVPSFVKSYHSELLKGRPPRQGEAPERLRRLTVDECLALQTFPSDYQLFGRQSSVYRQLGNAVPCGLAEAVARSVRSLMGEEAGISQAA